MLQGEPMALVMTRYFVEGNKTFAELTDNQKDSISHRGKALRELTELLRKKYTKG